jgi:4'-phosphopantetheinyl transferase
MQALQQLEPSASNLAFEDEWRPGPDVPIIHTSDTHVWRIDLSVSIGAEWESLLSEDEHHRAERFRFDRDRRRFMVGRSALRSILARYLLIDPAELIFQVNAFGKPYLRDHGCSLRFNLSHSHELALLAVAAGREVGIGIEFIRANVSPDEVAQNFFSLGEMRQLRSIDAEFRRTALFDCWTRKAAYIKARGQGMFMPLDQFDVAFGVDEPPALLANHLEPSEVSRWSFRQLFPGDNYAATVVVEGNVRDVELWELRATCCQAESER